MKGHYIQRDALAEVRVAVVMKAFHDHGQEAWKSIGYGCGQALVPALQHCKYQVADFVQMFDVVKYGFVQGLFMVSEELYYEGIKRTPSGKPIFPWSYVLAIHRSDLNMAELIDMKPMAEPSAKVKVSVRMKGQQDGTKDAWNCIGMACGKALGRALRVCKYQQGDFVEMYDPITVGFMQGFFKTTGTAYSEGSVGFATGATRAWEEALDIHRLCQVVASLKASTKPLLRRNPQEGYGLPRERQRH